MIYDPNLVDIGGLCKTTNALVDNVAGTALAKRETMPIGAIGTAQPYGSTAKEVWVLAEIHSDCKTRNYQIDRAAANGRKGLFPYDAQDYQATHTGSEYGRLTLHYVSDKPAKLKKGQVATSKLRNPQLIASYNKNAITTNDGFCTEWKKQFADMWSISQSKVKCYRADANAPECGQGGVTCD